MLWDQKRRNLLIFVVSLLIILDFRAEAVFDKWNLWSTGAHLRGANIYQRRVYPELDGTTFMGSGAVGPPYTQEDFNRLAALGANYVNVSHPGLFTENPPYTLDQDIRDNLDNLLTMIANADMFAVISFRTGPGRSEFTFFFDDVGDWFDGSYLNDSVWQDQAAQDAWVDMWRYTAERYRSNPIVVGYDLMVEPNSNEVGGDALNPLDVWDAEEFYQDYGNTLYDWNQLYPRITDSIREADTDTPILIGGMSYSAVDWLPYLQPTGDPRTVYMAHQYAPVVYTHQEADSLDFTYPGTFDADWDDVDDQVDRAWLDDLLSTMDDFVTTYGVPVAVNEFGVVRWVPGGADFMDDQMDLFEQRGINHALWMWEVSWEDYAEEVTAFNFRLGPDPDNVTDVSTSDLIQVIKEHWALNTIRPSTIAYGFSIELYTGWNLISLPLKPDDTSIETVLGSIWGYYDSVWTYDALTEIWSCYAAHVPDFFSDLTTMEAGPGYWIDVIAPCTLDITGESIADTAIPLKRGWNLIGYNSLTARSREDALSAIAGIYDSVWTYNTLTMQWSRYDVNGSDAFNDLDQMKPGKGYWLCANQDYMWSSINDFVYQLQNMDLVAIGDTNFDLVIIDYSQDGSEAGRFTAEQINALRNSSGDGESKVVLAYMSIGEAEDYRWYWNSNWDPNGDGVPDTGAPSWLGLSNPDWIGNYKVKYWEAGWQNIIYGSAASYLDKIIEVGFDGVYLDIIDAYEYWGPDGASSLDRITAEQEMVDFVKAIADYARITKSKASFYVFPQNGEALVSHSDYVQVVSGIGKEDLWYDDNTPQPASYTSEAIADLDIFKQAGKLVLVVDYVTQQNLIDDFYSKAETKGYVPYATVRDLDILTINPGHEPD